MDLYGRVDEFMFYLSQRATRPFCFFVPDTNKSIFITYQIYHFREVTECTVLRP